jgi:hypothetical protein
VLDVLELPGTSRNTRAVNTSAASNTCHLTPKELVISDKIHIRPLVSLTEVSVRDVASLLSRKKWAASVFKRIVPAVKCYKAALFSLCKTIFPISPSLDGFLRPLVQDPGQIQNLVLMARSWLVVHFRDLEKTYR